LTGLTVVVVVVAGSTLSFAIDQQEEKASRLFFNPKEKLETILREIQIIWLTSMCRKVPYLKQNINNMKKKK
jgi:hypothetical protein